MADLQRDICHVIAGKDSYDYQGVGRWTKRQKINVLERDIILIPVNLSNYHWVCAYVDIRNRRFVYLDSMHKDDYGGVLPNLQRWIHDEVGSATRCLLNRCG